MASTSDVRTFLEACRRAKAASIERWTEYKETRDAAVGLSRGYCTRLVRQAIKDIAANPAADTIIRRAYERLEENAEAFKRKL